MIDLKRPSRLVKRYTFPSLRSLPSVEIPYRSASAAKTRQEILVRNAVNEG